MKFKHKLNGLDWNGTSSTAAKPRFELFPGGELEKCRETVEVAYKAIDDLTVATYLILWYSQPHRDLLIVPTRTQGQYSMLLVQGGEIEETEMEQTQMDVLRTVLDFARLEPKSLEVVITDRKLCPYEHELLDDTEGIEFDRNRHLQPRNCPQLSVKDKYLVLPGPYWNKKWNPDRYAEEIDISEVEKQLQEHVQCQ